jgi:dTDP-4-amino-4,6-dideoxygalactose transaminase
MEIAYTEVVKAMKGNLCPRRSITPPNRLETKNWELIALLAQAPGTHSLEALRTVLRKLTGRRQVFFAPSCRCAIAQILTLLPQPEVVMPAFTCPVVKTAAEVAGKSVVYVDIKKNGINATSAEYAKQAENGRVLLPTHLFGIPTDIEAICALAKERNCVTIEDAAAAFGARHNGRLLGTFGDFGVFSFERSKRLPAFCGAAVVVNNESLIDPAKLASSRWARIRRRIPVKELARALVYNVATIPWLYGRVSLQHILQRYANSPTMYQFDEPRTVTKTCFYTRDFHPYQAALVLRMLKRFDRIREQIAQLVSIYIDVLRNSPIETFIPSGSDGENLLLRFPIVFRGKERSDVLRLALRRGLYLETNYERALPEMSEYAKFPNSIWAARNLLLLPLYTALSRQQARDLAVGIREIGMEVSGLH